MKVWVRGQVYDDDREIVGIYLTDQDRSNIELLIKGSKWRTYVTGHDDADFDEMSAVHFALDPDVPEVHGRQVPGTAGQPPKELGWQGPRQAGNM